MEEDLLALLAEASSVTALVPAARINWGAHPQGAGWPGVVLYVISGARGLHMQGPNAVAESRVQIDCHAMTYGAAKGVSRAVIDLLDGYRGGGFRLVEHVATRDSREGGTNEAERPFRVSLDFTINWRAD